jgi:hypothetical protein
MDPNECITWESGIGLVEVTVTLPETNADHTPPPRFEAINHFYVGKVQEFEV